MNSTESAKLLIFKMNKNVIERGGGEIKGMADEMGLLNRM
jgi:hypothetical protein